MGILERLYDWTLVALSALKPPVPHLEPLLNDAELWVQVVHGKLPDGLLAESFAAHRALYSGHGGVTLEGFPSISNLNLSATISIWASDISIRLLCAVSLLHLHQRREFLVERAGPLPPIPFQFPIIFD